MTSLCSTPGLRSAALSIAGVMAIAAGPAAHPSPPKPPDAPQAQKEAGPAEKAAPPAERAALPPVEVVRELEGQERSDAINARDAADRSRAAYEKAHRGGAGPAGDDKAADRAKADADFAAVVAAYRAAIDRYPATEVESDCRLRLAGAYQYRGQFDAALDEAKRAAERFAGTKHGLSATHTVGLIYLQALQDPAKAAVWFRQLQAAAATVDDEQERAKWQIAAEQGLARCRAR